MKKRFFSIILAVIMIFNVFVLPTNATNENLLLESYELDSVYYYDCDDPYNYVYGNEDYAYDCYIDTEFTSIDKLIFVHNNKIVKDSKTNENLLKMYFARNMDRSASYSLALEKARVIIDIDGDLRFTQVVDGIASLASTSLGNLSAFYLSGGASTAGEIADILAKASVKQIKDHFLDVGTILSESQLTIFHVSADQLKYYVSVLETPTDCTYFENCEKIADTADKLTKTVAGTCVLMMEITSNLDTSILSILGGYVGDVAKGFVGSFSEIIISTDKIQKLVSTDSEYVARMFELAIRLAEMKKMASLEDVGKAVEALNLTSDTSLCVIKAYKEYANTKTPMYYLNAFNSLAINEHGYHITPDNEEFINECFYPTVADGIYTIKNAESGLMMNVYGGINKDETNVVTWKYDGATDQQFYIKHIENGKYAIFAVCSDNGNGSYTRCLDVYTGEQGAIPETGDNIDIYTRNSVWNEAQLFYIVLTEYGSYAFESCYSPQHVIGAENPESNNGNIRIEQWNSEISQTWELCNTAGFVESDAFENDYSNTGDYNEDIIGVAYTQNGYIELDPATGEPVFYTPDDLDSGIVKPFYSKYGDYFGNSDGQWCAYFVMWCAAEADIPKTALPQERKYGNCGTFVQWFKDNGKWRDSDYTPVPGDIIFFYDENPNAASHVGIVESVNPDGSIETIEGNTLNENYYQVCHKTRSSNILGYGVLSETITDGAANGFIVEGGKTVGKAYMLPDKNAESVWYVDTDDRCIILSYDPYTDFYLLMYPFLDTGKYVTAYVPGDIVSVYMEPYVPIPDIDEFYTINKQIYLSEETISYHNPSTTALMNGSKDVRVRAEWDVDTQVTVLFEYNNYYFVTTETQSGFVPKEKIDINSTYTPAVPENPEVPETPETPDDPEPPTPPSEETYHLGDVNMDGALDRADGTLILEYCAEICLLSDEQLALADANSDGLVNVADAGFIFTTLTNTEG